MKGVDMKIMTRLASLFSIVFLCSGPAFASDTEELTEMLHTFLTASGEEQAHARFWADDLVYTSSAGLRFGKAEIMSGFEGSDADDAATDDGSPVAYTGEEIDIRIYGDVAIVAFKLVGTPTDKSGDADVLYYFNTGTFLKRDGAWSVVAWQATIIPPM
jgi:ketosteroid isomerase-like protein